MKRAKSKFISLLLIAVMLFNALPSTVATAVSPETDAPATQSVTTVPNPDYVEVGTVRELESRREENVKHFLLPDNTVQAVVYADAVHRKDNGGHWQDISNDLTLTEVKGVKFYTTADERVVFAEKFAPNSQLWQLSENGYSIAMGMAQLQLSADATVTPVGGVTVTNAAQRRSATWHSVEEARVVDNAASIVYSNVRSNTDLEYVMTGNDIKENIVVKSKSNSYSYSFEMTLTGLSAVLNEDGSISLTDSTTGQQQYSIPAPYMVDAAGEYSESVSYTLKQTLAGVYALTVTADSTWINAEDRVFPVKIDPSVTTTVTADVDTYINPRYPNKNYGSAANLWIFEGTAALFKITMPALPEAAQIQAATLNVSYYYYDSVTTGDITAGAYLVEQDWDASTHTWNIANQYTNQGISTEMIGFGFMPGNAGAYQSSPGWVSFNVLDAVRAWKNGTPNYGVAIRYYDGTNTSVILNSYDSGTTHRPYFSITYTEGRIAEGVYMLQNVATNYFMDVRSGRASAGTLIQQNSLTQAQYYNKQRFKITWLQEINGVHYYNIRPMVNCGLGLSAPVTGDTRNVTIESISLTDAHSMLNSEHRWIIEQSGSYFTLRNGDINGGGYLSVQSDSKLALVVTTPTLTEYGQWQLHRYTGSKISGADIVNIESEIEIGSQIDFNAIMYSSEIGINGPPVFSVHELDMSDTDKATIDPTTGLFTAIKGGTVSVGVTFAGADFIYIYDVKLTTATCAVVFAEVIYDEAYPMRYSQAVQRIIMQMNALQERYITEFDIWIEFSQPTQFESYADKCIDTPTGTCPHATDATCENSVADDINNYHHNNFSNNTERIIEERRKTEDQSRSFLIAYLGHDTCHQITERDQNDEDNDGDTDEDVVRHAINPFLGMGYNGCGLVVVSYTGEPEYTEQEWVTIETEVLFHEFGHLFFALDHYDDNDNDRIIIPSTDEIIEMTGDLSYSQYCIYGERNREYSVLNSFTICEGCKSEIIENKSYYSHTGW